MKLNDAELNNFFRMLHANSTDSIEIAIQLAKTAKIPLSKKMYESLLKISSEFEHGLYMPTNINKTKLSELIRILNAARTISFKKEEELAQLNFYQYFNEIQKVNIWALNLVELPESLRYFKTLRKVNFGNNLLSHIPDWMGELQQLKEINLLFNRFSIFPEEICQISGLRELHLSNNVITTISDKIANLKNLEYLGLTDNQVKKLPEGIFELKKLRILSLGRNPIEQASLDKLKEALPKCKVYLL